MRKMIIIGSSNNFNELGIVRSFGVNGIKPYGIIICNKKQWKHDWLHQSKYWTKCYRVDSGKEAIEFLIKQFSGEKEKPCVTTPVDYIVQMLDDRFDVLSSKFILPNINNKEGKITYYSNKLRQAELTRELGFESLTSEIIILNEFDENKQLDFPIILKPAACGEGSKDDIVICKNMSEMAIAINKLKRKNYRRILCQKYLENRTEIIAYGAVSKKFGLVSYTVLKNIRQWPESYGVGSYGALVLDQYIQEFVNKFYYAIMQFGYDGPLDTDIFIDNDTGKIYVSEYNWRPGGRNYTSLGTEVHSLVLWYLLNNNIDVSKYQVINKVSGYIMNDFTDFNHVINGEIKLKQWKKEFKKSIACALFFKDDIVPVILPVAYTIKKLFKR